MQLLIEGIIGSGKSYYGPVITNKLEHCKFYSEIVQEAFLADLYYDLKHEIRPSLVATTLQFRVLYDRFRRELLCDLYSLNDDKYSCVVDRSMLGDLTFVEMLTKSNFILKRDYQTYIDMREFFINQIIYDRWICVFLDLPIDVCYEQIQRRGRTYELSITKDYLYALRSEYSHLMFEMNKLGIKVFVVHNQDTIVEEVLEQCNAICSKK